ncbi:MAG TPA: M23 family metallopeptidase [Capillibacterium sp.]
MELSEQKEIQVELDREAQEQPPDEPEGEPEATLPKNFPFLQWERLLLKQILVCLMILFLLWLTGKIPGIGPGLVDRFRYVLKYGENNRTEEKLTAFARRQWEKVKTEVSSWFRVDVQPVTTPSGRPIQLAAPIYYFEGRQIYPQRIRYLLASSSSVYASTAGVVTEITQEKGGWKLKLDHGEGWQSIYYPCPQVFVKLGQWVSPGQEIARTGREFFWEITSGGYPVDPRPFIEEAGLWR